MRNLIRFLINNHFTILFLFLEIIAIILLTNFNSFHDAGLYNIRHSLVGSISEKFTDISKYLSLNEQNKKLVLENARLYNQLQSSKYSYKDESYLDSLFDQQFRFIPARVINNSVNKQNNLITLNKGSIHGIKKDMGVIAPNGAIGVVNNVSKRYSTVLSILNKKFHPNAKIKHNNFTGAIDWPGVNYRKVELTDIPSDTKINIGDSIVTSGHSATFPEGIMIGTITDYKIEKGVHYTITVELSNDFKSLTNVMVIDNLFRKEQKELENNSTVND